MAQGPFLLVVLLGCRGKPSTDETVDTTPQPVPTTSDETGSTTPVDPTIEIFEEVPFIEEPLQGQLYEQLGWLNDNGEPTRETSPFIVMQLQPEPIAHAYPDYFSTPDRCWRNVPQHLLVGNRDVGAQVALTIGTDEIPLRRNRSFSPGETLYLFSPWSDDLNVGNQTGAELVLAGTPTGVKVPEPFEWSASSWTNLTETAVLDAEWVPGQGDAFIWLDLRLYKSASEYETLICALRDDGRARIDAGWRAEDLLGVELIIARMNQGVVDHPEFGRLYVTSFRNLHMAADHSNE